MAGVVGMRQKACEKKTLKYAIYTLYLNLQQPLRMLADKQKWKLAWRWSVSACFSKMNTFNWSNPSQFYDWTFLFNDKEQGNTAYVMIARICFGIWKSRVKLDFLLMIRFLHKNDGQQWQTQEVHEDGFRNLSGFIKNHSQSHLSHPLSMLKYT